MSARHVLPLLVAVTLLVGCTRSRAPRIVEPAVTLPPVPASTATPGVLVIASPRSGDRVSSPVTVTGTVTGTAGRTLAAVIYARGADDSVLWRGNGPLAIDGGVFTGQVPYTLEADGPGTVEAMLIDPVTGTVLERQSVPIELRSAP